MDLKAKPINVVEPVLPLSLTAKADIIPLPSKGYSLDLPILGPKAGVHLVSYSEWSDYVNHVRLVENEKYRMQKELSYQQQVNSELKRMLVASMGEDLQVRIDKLIRENVELTKDLRWFRGRTMEDHEALDKVSIQADMWRSKFLGSKLMADELSRSKALYSVRYQESHEALMGLLNERHELRAHLLQTHGNLKNIKSAFDPLGNLAPDNPASNSDILDLTASIQQLSQNIKFRLLPPQSNIYAQSYELTVKCPDTLTKAESIAQDILQRQVDVDQFHVSVDLSALKCRRKISRYHADVKFDDLTYNCCSKCNGEIHVI